MCGIVGVAPRQPESLIRRMMDAIRHRGPDADGVFLDPEGMTSLGHVRLSILDISGGSQPMSSPDGRLRIVFNGEIFNAPELRARLESQGAVFRTANSDTEVLLHLYAAKSFEMLHDLNGMFSFAILDQARNILFCARDHAGIKPFYYSCRGGRFAFASELKSLLALDWVSRDLDEESLYHYLSLQFTPAPQSIFKDVRKLPAGHSLMYDLSKRDLVVRRYWDLDFAPDHSRSREEWVDAVRTELRESVLRWTLSDVPVACSLSGGLDSSAIVGIMASHSENPARTYSLGFSGPGEEDFSELDLARKVAKLWGTDHHELVLPPEELPQDLEKMVRSLDEPYGGGLPSWYVFRRMGLDCKVAMTGSGGDELFGNYAKWARYELGVLPRLFRALSGLASDGFGSLKDARRFPHGHHYHRYLSDAAKDALALSGKRRTFRGTEAMIEELWKKSGQRSPRNAAAYVDFNMQLPEEFLLMTDRFSMAHSVEARTPFLDRKLIKLVFLIPPALRTTPGDPKRLLREAVKPYLPPELLTAPKRGFVTPLTQWTRTILRERIERTLAPDRLKKRGLLSPVLFEKIVKPHLRGKRDQAQQVWTLFMFELWAEAFLE